MTDKKPPETITVRSAVDFDIVGENIHDIAEFAIERYEFTNETTLSAEQREEAIRKIRDELWTLVEKMKARRKQWLKALFDTANGCVAEVAGE